MRLSSIEFIVFLSLVAGIYHATRGRASRWVLLAASVVFYGSFLQPWWMAALAATIVVTWAAALAVQRARSTGGALGWMWLGSAFGLLLLCALKYLGLAAQTINLLLGWSGSPARFPVLEPMLFLGLSYYVFQSISYIADVYLEAVDAEPSLAWVALHLAFFPKLVQGPIERAGHLLPQLKAPYRWDAALVRRGAVLFCWGLFKKVVVAERLAPMVDAVFLGLGRQTAPTLLATAWLFALQLFMDFSGYTDMALGAAALFNVSLTDNFNEPYFASSMKDFWRRWHITLSTWILDYVFQPLLMVFRYWDTVGVAAALFISFFLMGVWHGATAAYVVFGLVQGMFMALSVLYKPLQKRLHQRLGIAKAPWLPVWQVFFTLNLVVLSFALFRAGTLANAATFYGGLFHGWDRPDFGSLSGAWDGPLDAWVLALSLVAAACGELARRRASLADVPAWARWTGYFALIAWVLLFGRFYTQKQFIYAQF